MMDTQKTDAFIQLMLESIHDLNAAYKVLANEIVQLKEKQTEVTKQIDEHFEAIIVIADELEMLVETEKKAES